MTRRTAFLLIYVLLLATVLKEVKIAKGSQMLRVPTQFATIQAAINNAADGDIIYAYNGTYYENLILNKSVTLVGQGKSLTIVDGGGINTVIYISANNVSIMNLTIRNGGFIPASSGVFVAAVNVKIIDNVITGNYFGIRLLNSKGCVVDSCHITGNYIGISAESSLSNSLDNNNVTKNGEAGVQFRYSDRNIVRSNNISRNGVHGIYMQYSTGNVLTSNLVTDHENGISIYNSGNNTLRDNILNLNKYNFGVSGDRLSDFIQDIDPSNMVNGKILLYLINQKDVSINPYSNPAVGYLAIVNSTNVAVKDLNLTENSEGILLAYTNGATLTNCTIANNGKGALLIRSEHANLTGNVVTSNVEGIILSASGNSVVERNMVTMNTESGIKLESSANSVIAENNVTLNDGGGVYLYSSENCELKENAVVNNPLGFGLQFSDKTVITRNLIANNSGEGVYLNYCDDCTIKDNNITGNMGHGIHQSSCNLNVIAHNSLISNHQYGLYLYDSQFNLVEENIASSSDIGIYVYYSSNNTLLSNNATDNFNEGIDLRFSDGSYVSNNVVSNNRGYGLYIFSSKQNRVVGNQLFNNGDGLHLFATYESTISQNEILENDYGTRLSYSKNNKIFHNHFINNSISVQALEQCINAWDDGYPDGGNFWSDYQGQDFYGGPYQNLIGSDGIGDQPYVIDEYNRDEYPLMMPSRIHDVTLIDVEVYSAIVYVGWLVEANVTVKNVGNYMERINVTLYYDNTKSENRIVENFPIGATVTITFITNTTGLAYGNYTITATVGPLAGENNTDDNSSKVEVCVTAPGDVDADGDVDLYDVVKICAIYGYRIGHEGFNANCDINSNRKIDIYDVVIACSHYGLRPP